MSRNLLAVLAVAAAGVACSGGVPTGSDREAAVAALQKEAEGLKRDGEKMDPALGVKATWNIASVDVKEQPDNKDRPLAGTIKFHISSRNAHDPTGATEHNFERTFEYEYDKAIKIWLLKPNATTRSLPAPPATRAGAPARR
jgi:hypothetical protein